LARPGPWIPSRGLGRPDLGISGLCALTPCGRKKSKFCILFTHKKVASPKTGGHTGTDFIFKGIFSLKFKKNFIVIYLSQKH
jgi:hypothetical protein